MGFEHDDSREKQGEDILEQIRCHNAHPSGGQARGARVADAINFTTQTEYKGTPPLPSPF